jgi:hypothetical protein
VRTLLNIIWLLLCGIWLALGYALAGIICCILIVTIPFGLAGRAEVPSHGTTRRTRPGSGAGSPYEGSAVLSNALGPPELMAHSWPTEPDASENGSRHSSCGRARALLAPKLAAALSVTEWLRPGRASPVHLPEPGSSPRRCAPGSPRCRIPSAPANPRAHRLAVRGAAPAAHPVRTQPPTTSPCSTWRSPGSGPLPAPDAGAGEKPAENPSWARPRPHPRAWTEPDSPTSYSNTSPLAPG